MAPVNPPACYFAFERAFPAADSLLAAALIFSGVDSLRGGAWGGSVALGCAGALLFLGVLDFSFSLQNGVFSGPLPDALQSALISLWCVLLGLAIVAVRAPRGQGA